MEAITSCDLPEDVMNEILTRLPVKSLLRFKCVRKSWYALIENPKFISKHLNNASSNDDYARIAIKYSKIYPSKKWNVHSVDKAFISFLSNEAEQLSHEIASPFFDDDNPCSNDLRFYGPCNGIICVAAVQRRMPRDNDFSFIAFWNPATREIKWLLDSNLRQSYDDEVSFVNFGFGFDSKSNDYKVVRIIEFTNLVGLMPQIEEPKVEVYRSSTDSWRKMDVDQLPRGIVCWTDFSTYLNEFYYWWAFDSAHDCMSILSFQFATEVFEKIPAPDISHPSSANLVKFNETIAVIADVSKCYNDCISICVLNIDGDGQKKTWTKMYEIRLLECVSLYTVVGLLSSGEALMVVKNDDGGDHHYLAAYDPSAQQLKSLQANYPNSYGGSFQMVHYVESLVSFKGARDLRK